MMVDANQLSGSESIESEICIVGAGAAGIAIASALDGTSKRVLVIESGGTSFDQSTQDLSEGEVSGPYASPLHLTCRRGIGGTTAVWSGACLPLDDIDFESREYLPLSGWPFLRHELLSHYEWANRFCEAGSFDYSAKEWLESAFKEMIPGMGSGVLQTDKVLRYSRPTRFGRRFRAVIEDSSNISLVYNATCTAIRLQPNGKRVQKLMATTSGMTPIELSARYVVLAMGCIETTRLLLASNDVARNGIGNHSGKLGRYYMTHLQGTLGELQAKTGVNNVYERTRDNVYVRRLIAPLAQTQRRHQIGNFNARLHQPILADPTHRAGILSATYLLEQLVLPERYTLSKRNHVQELERMTLHRFRSHLRNVVIDLPTCMKFCWTFTTKRVLARRKLPPPIYVSRDNRYPLFFSVEQSPHADNRLTLLSERDRLSFQKVRLDWRMNDFDRRTIRVGAHLIRDEMLRSGCGDLLLGHLVEQVNAFQETSGHHMGTTRMAISPSDGVVDENCRIHGLENIYVSGSAVFPTAGHANPTLTIVALAKRLADHLESKDP